MIDASGLVNRQSWFNRCYPALGQADVDDCLPSIGRIHNQPTFNKDIELGHLRTAFLQRNGLGD
jgi:hypothetical protein